MLLRTASDIFWPFLTQDDYIYIYISDSFHLISVRKCSRHCQCCCFCACCRDEWRTLENLPCSPGRWAKLRHGSCVLCLVSCDILSHLARSRTTPISSVLHLDSPTVPAHHELALRQEWGFWVSATFYVDRLVIFKLVNLSTACEGYPMAFLATWAFTSRCGLILLIAISLRPAPSPVQHQGVFKKLELHQSKAVTIQETKVEEHHMERETREQFLGSFKMIQNASKCIKMHQWESILRFDVLLALHLCDFSWDSWLDYSGCILSMASKVFFDWSVMICDDLCVIACHCLPFWRGAMLGSWGDLSGATLTCSCRGVELWPQPLERRVRPGDSVDFNRFHIFQWDMLSTGYAENATVYRVHATGLKACQDGRDKCGLPVYKRNLPAHMEQQARKS